MHATYSSAEAADSSSYYQQELNCMRRQLQSYVHMCVSVCVRVCV